MPCTHPRRRFGSGPLPSSGTVGPGHRSAARSPDGAFCHWEPEAHHRCGLRTAPTGLQSPGRTRQSYPDRTGTAPGPGSASKMCSSRQWPCRDLAMVASSALILGSRNCASFLGFRSPSTMAAMMSMPVLPVMSLMTWWSFTFIWVRAFCMCWICWDAYSTSMARCRR